MGKSRVHRFVFMRHGESEYNLQRKFTGWADADLSPHGVLEAKAAGRLLHEKGISFDVAFTSYLKRAIRTMWIVLEEMDLCWIPVNKTWRLNERNYGALQGMDKDDVIREYGIDLVRMWRRGYDHRPPPLNPDDPRHPRFDCRYSTLEAIPSSESLKDTRERIRPIWHDQIKPLVRACDRVLVCAHGNVLRAFIMEIESLSSKDIFDVEIPTGVPIAYEFDDDLELLCRYRLDSATVLNDAPLKPK